MRTAEELQDALVQCIAEKDELVGECERLRTKLQGAMFDLSAVRQMLKQHVRVPYPKFCSTPELCTGHSNCQQERCCAD